MLMDPTHTKKLTIIHQLFTKFPIQPNSKLCLSQTTSKFSRTFYGGVNSTSPHPTMTRVFRLVVGAKITSYC